MEIIISKRHNRFNTKFEYEKGFVPTHPNPEARICLECDPNKKCNGDCKRFKEDHRKLKEQENE